MTRKEEIHCKIYNSFPDDLISYNNYNDIKDFVERKMTFFAPKDNAVYEVKFNKITKGVKIIMMTGYEYSISTYFNRKETQGIIQYIISKARCNNFEEDKQMKLKKEKEISHNIIYENFIDDLIHHDDSNDVRNFIERKMKCFSAQYKVYMVKFNNFTKGVTISMVKTSGIISTYFNKKETQAMILYVFHKADAYNKFKED